MKNFEWVTPNSLEQAIELLPRGRTQAERDATKLVAGGQDLLTELKEHLVEPDTLVDLKRIPGLDALESTADGGLKIGALVRLATLEKDAELRARVPMLCEAAESIASPQIRSRATVGGNLCQRPRCWYYRSEHAVCIKKGGAECFSYSGLSKYNAILGGGPSYIVHPSDLAPALVALDAEATILGPRGERTLPLEHFFTLPSEGSVLRETVLAANEVLVSIQIPGSSLGAEHLGTYLKFKERESYDFALGSVALRITKDGSDITGARLVLGAVAPIPWRVAEAEALFVGRALDDELAIEVGQRALAGAEPLEHNGYKIALTQGLIRKAVAHLAQVGGRSK